MSESENSGYYDGQEDISSLESVRTYLFDVEITSNSPINESLYRFWDFVKLLFSGRHSLRFEHTNRRHIDNTIVLQPAWRRSGNSSAKPQLEISSFRLRITPSHFNQLALGFAQE